jgi:hypothetical protein
MADVVPPVVQHPHLRSSFLLHSNILWATRRQTNRVSIDGDREDFGEDDADVVDLAASGHILVLPHRLAVERGLVVF